MIAMPNSFDALPTDEFDEFIGWIELFDPNPWTRFFKSFL